MKKDVNKIFERTLLTYTFILFFIFILKIAGFNYFGLDINNPVVVAINNFATKFHLVNLWYILTLYLYSYVTIAICCRDNSRRAKIYVLVTLPFSILLKVIASKITLTLIIYLMDFLYLFSITYLYKFIFKIKIDKFSLNFIFYIILNSVYQLISLFLRNINFYNNYNNFITNCLLDLDYIIALLITKYIIIKEDKSLCGMVVSYFSGLLILSKEQFQKFPAKFLKTKNEHKNKTKKEKFEIDLYLILFLLWNIFQVFVVLFIAKLNNGLPECIFILLSFWMNKTVFGKAFHMKRARDCFIVSNLAYYVLVRICISIHISLLIPIILGILLSYFTSLIVKYNEFKLYRGMPEEDLLLHCKICNLNKYDTTLMVDYYCNRKSDVQLAMKNHYSVESIKKQKKKIREILIKK